MFVIVAVGLVAFLSLNSFSMPFPVLSGTQDSSDVVPPAVSQTEEVVDTKLGMGAAHGGSHLPQETESPSVPAGSVAGCSLQFSISPAAPSVAPGGTISYSFTLKNSGNTTCNNTSYSVYYAENQSYVSASPAPSASNYYWRVGSLKKNKTHTASVTTKHVAGSEGSTINLEACASASNAVADACVTVSVAVTGTGTVVASPVPSTPGPISTNTGFDAMTGKEYGVWVWDSPVQMTAAKAEEVINQAAAADFNTVYITIDDYLDIAVLPDGATKTSGKQQYMNALNRIIVKAKALGIEIDVEGGWKDWGDLQNTWKGYALIDFVKEYNQLYPQAKIRGLQYDVEPYLLSTYERNKVGALLPYVAFIDESVKRMKNVDATFTIVIPHFYDSTQRWTPLLTYNEEVAYPFTHLLKILEQKPGSSIIIMAYRNFFTGADGVEGLSVPELKEASNGNYSTKVIIAQETGNVSPDYVTFFGLSKEELYVQLSTIQTSFAKYTNFGGSAVHYLDPYLELR